MPKVGLVGLAACTTAGIPASTRRAHNGSRSVLPRDWPAGVGMGESMMVVAPSAMAHSSSASAHRRSLRGSTAAQRNRMGSADAKSCTQPL